MHQSTIAWWFVIAKDLLPYQAPKLANIEQTTNERKEIVIKWADPVAQVGREHELTEQKTLDHKEVVGEVKEKVAESIFED